MKPRSCAGPIIVDTEAEFLGLVDGPTVTEGFEGLPGVNGCTNGPTSFSTATLSVTTTPQGGGSSWLCIGTTTSDQPGPTEGQNALIAGSNTGDPWILSFQLESAVNAVYFELTDAVERGDAFIDVHGLEQILVAEQGSGGLEIVAFGIVTHTSFTEFSLINTGIADGWGVDNMIFASVPVAAPGAIGLLGIGVLALALGRRRMTGL